MHYPSSLVILVSSSDAVSRSAQSVDSEREIPEGISTSLLSPSLRVSDVHRLSTECIVLFIGFVFYPRNPIFW
jgi:hypothetical protein